MKAYNYTIVDEYRQKIHIPILGIEFTGWLPLIALVLGNAACILFLYIILNFLIGKIAIYIACIVSLSMTMIIILFSNDLDSKSGRNKLLKYYYTNIKNYSVIYDRFGDQHVITKKKEGVKYT
ncbi:MAG: hypothetical protein RSD85_03765, partial [Erysipelotrichaceae bacterium]